MSHNFTRVAVEFSAGWTELTAAPETDVVRIQASDLRESQQHRARLRAEAVDRGESADSTAVFLDLEIHIAADARTARREFAALDAPSSPSSIRYVGTPAGLASLISDVTAADVADGVTLTVLGDVARQSVLINNGVLPLLESRGTRLDIDVVDAVLGAPIAPTLAS
ncbi:hypothetical protein O4160_18475 [Rhodococcus sp. IEGM 1401]|uniref:hypothetical protein n=1 Tax=unclassified Rhodococcus (in: high G+C Gram-positive bacteria) TaxID=192944 RepID=UPI0022B3464F|nr:MULTISPECIES: hypothetical protein [unclassified Rhodococcus (in: high G+C Gram-positive bacteria)]MCZ4562832.1 hypothetical protein [Rhodococcus sp. IEGM 1401]MDI9922955.1 hypothetical protein [Rhodococcus sp. IEGM 1372]MDV8035453.1 hypothetical protein [Rhodococcus sp. IEGM 1414]